jgi:hypothetical protein
MTDPENELVLFVLISLTPNFGELDQGKIVEECTFKN